MDAPAARAGALLLAALGFVALLYSNAFAAPFVWDDHHLIEADPSVRELRPLPEYFGRSYWSDQLPPRPLSYYRPLITLSYALDHRLWDGRPAGFHLTNVTLHLLVCALLFALCRRAGAPAVEVV